MSDTKYAIVTPRARNTVGIISNYMPGNYQAIQLQDVNGEDGDILIYGEDFQGWTMQDYVLPRLASGLIAARELVIKEMSS